MTPNPYKPLRTWEGWIALWFGAGLSPKAPGTAGSLAALPFAWVIHAMGGAPALIIASLALFALGTLAAGRYAQGSGRDDPGEVVVDEVAGQWLTLVGVISWTGMTAAGFVAGFVLFRLFDIWKPWPISLADQRVKGGLGIMLDDMIAGAIAAVLLYGIGIYLGA